MNESQYNFGKEKLQKVASKWGVPVEKAAEILNDFSTAKGFYDWVNADEFLNEFVYKCKFTDFNGEGLKIDKKYILVTYNELGCLEPQAEWINVTWNGLHLVAEDGCKWDEWLDTPLDIFPKKD